MPSNIEPLDAMGAAASLLIIQWQGRKKFFVFSHLFLFILPLQKKNIRKQGQICPVNSNIEVTKF